MIYYDYIIIDTSGKLTLQVSFITNCNKYKSNAY